jgi:ribosomal protein L37AE/L43A
MSTMSLSPTCTAHLEGIYDVRHIGRYLIYEYCCPDCGSQFVPFDPDYPYCGPNTVWTCRHCANVMRLVSAQPIYGRSRLAGTDNVTVVRGSH